MKELEPGSKFGLAPVESRERLGRFGDLGAAGRREVIILRTKIGSELLGKVYVLVSATDKYAVRLEYSQ